MSRNGCTQSRKGRSQHAQPVFGTCQGCHVWFMSSCSSAPCPREVLESVGILAKKIEDLAECTSEGACRLVAPLSIINLLKIVMTSLDDSAAQEQALQPHPQPGSKKFHLPFARASSGK